MLQGKDAAQEDYERLRNEDATSDMLGDISDTQVDQAAQISEMQDYLEAAMGVKFKLKGVRKLGQ